ncbi:hypothetical protein MJ524_22860 [Escherichia coli]|nr:hypothetical protein MJ524_22860 [Escherichia coli]
MDSFSNKNRSVNMTAVTLIGAEVTFYVTTITLIIRNFMPVSENKFIKTQNPYDRINMYCAENGHFWRGGMEK